MNTSRIPTLNLISKRSSGRTHEHDSTIVSTNFPHKLALALAQMQYWAHSKSLDKVRLTGIAGVVWKTQHSCCKSSNVDGCMLA